MSKFIQDWTKTIKDMPMRPTATTKPVDVSLAMQGATYSVREDSYGHQLIVSDANTLTIAQVSSQWANEQQKELAAIIRDALNKGAIIDELIEAAHGAVGLHPGLYPDRHERLRAALAAFQGE